MFQAHQQLRAHFHLNGFEIQSGQPIQIYFASGHGQALFQFVRQIAKIAIIEIRQGL